MVCVAVVVAKSHNQADSFHQVSPCQSVGYLFLAGYPPGVTDHLTEKQQCNGRYQQGDQILPRDTESKDENGCL